MSPGQERLVDGAVVVDTDVLSFWQKGDTRGRDYAAAVSGLTVVLSFQTVAEQLRWAAERNWGAPRREELERYLRQFVVFPFTFDLAREWAELMATSRKAGRTLSAGDAWVAATARLTGAPLATHNRNDFHGISGLTIITFAPA